MKSTKMRARNILHLHYFFNAHLSASTKWKKKKNPQIRKQTSGPPLFLS